MTESRRTISRDARKRATTDEPSPKSKTASETPYLDDEPKTSTRKKATTKRAKAAREVDSEATEKPVKRTAAAKATARKKTIRATKSVAEDDSTESAPAKKTRTVRKKTAETAAEETATRPAARKTAKKAARQSSRPAEEQLSLDAALPPSPAPSEPPPPPPATSSPAESAESPPQRHSRYHNRRSHHNQSRDNTSATRDTSSSSQSADTGESGDSENPQQSEDFRNNGHRGRYGNRFRHKGKSGHQRHGRTFSGRRQHNQRRRPYDGAPRPPAAPIEVEGEVTGWFDPHKEAGFIRSAANSYLAETNDPFVPAFIVRQSGLRRGDLVKASIGRDQRNRVSVVELLSVNDSEPEQMLKRPEFQSLTASYPERKLMLATGKEAKAGPELTRRAIDLIAPIGYGQRALIVAPARAGKTMLLQAVIEGIAINHPDATLFVLLVDERPEEVSDMISLHQGEVIASSFDMPAARHTEVAEMTLERARRLVELGRDVVIVLDSITRLARAYNTVERGTGRTLSGGLDSSAMAKPKAFFGSARSVADEHGGGSLTIIATALVETGSRMDDVIFEEFKGTGNCEIKLDRSLAEKRIFPAIDIPVSGTRREDKLFRPDQLEHVYTLRRGLQQMPSSAAMEWLIKRIASTINNDALLSGL